jgi:hypothetical protein
MIPALLVALAFRVTAQEARLPAGYRLLYATDFSAGIDTKIDQQKPKPESITVVPAPGGLSSKCLQVTMERGDDFSKVANGAPRSELAFGRQFRIESGKDYIVEWSTFLPVAYPFDGRQLECITQIHHGLRTGSPPFMLVLDGEKYHVEVRGGAADKLKKTVHALGSAAADCGNWVKWRLHYQADASGARAVLQLFKNGRLALDASGEPNAYVDDERAYWKMGIYKWGWQKAASDVEMRKVWYGDLVVAVKDGG